MMISLLHLTAQPSANNINHEAENGSENQTQHQRNRVPHPGLYLNKPVHGSAGGAGHCEPKPAPPTRDVAHGFFAGSSAFICFTTSAYIGSSARFFSSPGSFS